MSAPSDTVASGDTPQSLTRVVLIVALGGFLMGFDASVISGTVSAIEAEFGLSKLELGWVVASLTLTASLAMLVSGPLADRYGRRPVLKAAALIFALSAVLSAVAPNADVLAAARMLGGFGVGAALIVAPLYIAEIAPAEQRGKLVSFNQLNIVIGISAAYFSNLLVQLVSQMDAAWVSTLMLDTAAWRWMLGIEALPAIVYAFALMAVPESPRWLLIRGREEEASEALHLGRTHDEAVAEVAEISKSLAASDTGERTRLRELLDPRLRLVLFLGLLIAVLQQATGINAVFFYAPMIFEMSGVGTNASFMQAVLVGITNIVFTVVAISLIDKAGRRPLLLVGLLGVTICMSLLAYGFGQATYTLDADVLAGLAGDASALQALVGVTFDSDMALKAAVIAEAGQEGWQTWGSDLLSGTIAVNSQLILIGILGFVASFAVSLGPVMWVLLAELFPNRCRALAISVVGLVNSGVSFSVQFLFPWELDRFGASITFLVFGLVAAVGGVLVWRYLPETRQQSLEELEAKLMAK